MKPSVRAGLSGVGAAAVALGVAELVAYFTGPLSAPLFAVGGVVVDNVPGTVKDFAVATFGTHDKTALISGTAVLLTIYAYFLGVAAARRWRLGLAGIALFAVLGVAAAVTRHAAGVTAALPTLIGSGLALWVLHRLLALAAEASREKWAEPVAQEKPPVVRSPWQPADDAGAVAPSYGKSDLAILDSRRRFLQMLGLAVGAAAVTGYIGKLLTGHAAVNRARDAVTLPEPVQVPPTLPAGVQVPGVTTFVSSNSDFYRIDTALYPPQIDPTTWKLRIHGMVRNPITVTWDDLLKLPMIERYVTLACVSNEVGGNLIGNALWLGTPLKALLEQAGPLAGADQVIGRSSDGWTCGSPTSVLMDGRDALLAVGMNGQPLPIEHGFPVRMVVPGLYGYVSACKWITEIELSRFSDFDAYWVPRGWSQQAPIKTESRIDTPSDGATRSPGTVTIGGVAWAQHRGVKKVEVQVDDGPWETATLATIVSADTWCQWSYAWQATGGKHRVRVRATDTTGQTQTSTPAPPDPNGATGWHTISVSIN